MRFELRIELGNDDMQTGVDISVALEQVARQIEDLGLLSRGGEYGKIQDINGNSVGGWEVTK
ncbi:hypothetical protein LCGC14_2345070 [marine sediment metagenome]|uniref:Uncharacterized protein n=1 Tax=marine sediment metagenome TaxID=412755 RepID=A0A0F9ENJ4_9ZZZZ